MFGAITQEQLTNISNSVMASCQRVTPEKSKLIDNQISDILKSFPDLADQAMIQQQLVTAATASGDVSCLQDVQRPFLSAQAQPSKLKKLLTSPVFWGISMGLGGIAAGVFIGRSIKLPKRR
jgi:hypothetical protein